MSHAFKASASSEASAASVVSGYQTVRSKRTLFGHPMGLYVLFFTEMWERFSYYGMRVLLVLYMNKYLLAHAASGGTVIGFQALKSALEFIHGPLKIQPLSSEIYGVYTGLVYLTPIFGGMIADRLLGSRKTVVIGGVVMAIGHFLMAIESMFFVALLLLILGNGCFKPNISTQVGSLYPPGDPRRDRAFSIFYMGVNAGATLAPFICGTLGQAYGWHYGFSAAGVGMVLGLIVYISGQRFLAEDNFTRNAQAHKQKQPLTRAEKQTIWGLIALCALNIVFWGVYEQQGNTLQLFADANVDWHIFGWEMPSTWFQALNPIFIFTLVPLLSILWSWQSKKNREPSSIVKMALGCLLLGVGFLPLMWAVKDLAPDGKVSGLWMVGATFIYTLGEIYLSPVGLSLVSKVAPPRLVGMLMGAWFLSSAFGNHLSGIIGAYYEGMTKYNFFMLLMGLAIAAGVAIYSVQHPLKKAIGSH